MYFEDSQPLAHKAIKKHGDYDLASHIAYAVVVNFKWRHLQLKVDAFVRTLRRRGKTLRSSSVEAKKYFSYFVLLKMLVDMGYEQWTQV